MKKPLSLGVLKPIKFGRFETHQVGISLGQARLRGLAREKVTFLLHRWSERFFRRGFGAPDSFGKRRRSGVDGC